MNISLTRRRGAIVAAASVASLALTTAIQAQPIGNPTAGNGWSTQSGVAVGRHSGEAGGRDIVHLIDGGGIQGTNGDQMQLASGAAGFAYFGMSRLASAGGGNASAPNPGSLEGTAIGIWVEFELLAGVQNINDIAIWNDNEETYDQGWKHLAIQVSTTGGTSASDWTTVFNGILLQSPGPGDGVTPAHTP